MVGLFLHRLLGYRLCVFYGYRKQEQERVLVHVGVVDENYDFIDENGVWGHPDFVKEDLKEKNPPYDFFTYYVLTEKSIKWKVLLRRTNASKVNLLKAMEIKKWVKRVLIPHLISS